MPGRRVSGKRYAQALFELAVERGQLDQWADDLSFVAQSLQNAEFRRFLEHADVPAAEKIKAIDAGLPGVGPLVRNLVALLVTRGLVNLVHEVRVAYLQFLDEHRGRQPVEVTSAVALGPEEIERVGQFVADLVHKLPVISTVVDDSILGGVIIQIGDQLLDGSTRARLEGLRSRIRSDVFMSAA